MSAARNRPVRQRATVAEGRPADARRTREATELANRSASFAFRSRIGAIVMGVVLVVAAGQLFYLQVPGAAALRAQAASQLKVVDVEQAVRGAIVDRNDAKLAFTVEARALTFQPQRIREQLTEARQKSEKAPEPDARLREIAKGVAARMDDKPDYKSLLKKLRSDETFVYLARAVDRRWPG